MRKYIMVLDQGTTSSRTILFDREGRIVAQVNREFEQIFPKPGWVEHDPEEILNSQLYTMRKAMLKANAAADDIEAVGITNQRETTVVWEKSTGKPVYNAIVWQCRRTSDMVDDLLESGYGGMISQKTGLVPDAYFSATKIRWILKNVEGAEEKAKNNELLFGTIDTWLIWNLTMGKSHVTDYTNASRTMLFNINELKWDSELLDLFGIPECMMARPLKSSGIFGYVDSSVLGRELPIAGVAGDQQASLFGQCCFDQGDVKNTYGTGCFLLVNTGCEIIRSKSGLVTTVAAFTDEPQYVMEGSVFVAGAAMQWLRDEMHLIENSGDSEDIAGSIKDTGGVYLVPAFTGMGAPYWKQNARGIVVGLTRGTGSRQIVRAALESLAYQTMDIVKAMEKDLGRDISSLRVDGGACANDFLMQFQSDILDCKIIRPSVIETTGLGAAYLAGLATGFWKDKEELKKNCRIEREFSPEISEGERQNRINGWNKAVKTAIFWADN